MTDKIKIKLAFPFELEGTRYEELQMRRCKARDRLAVDRMEASAAEKEVRLIANLCEVSDKVIEELDWADYQKAGKTLAGFSNTAQPQR